MAAKRSAPRSEQHDPARLEREVKRLNELTSESLDTLNAAAEALEEIRGRLQLVSASAATLADRVCTISVANAPLASESLSQAADSRQVSPAQPEDRPSTAPLRSDTVMIQHAGRESVDCATVPLSCSEEVRTDAHSPVSPTHPTVGAAPANSTERKGPSKSDQQPLYMRLVQRPILTDIVRAIRYDMLTRDQAIERLASLREQYGDERLEQSASEILSCDNRGLWRLSDEAATYAFQIIGRRSAPPEQANGSESPPSNESPEDASEPPLDISRDEAIRLYQDHLRETDQPFRKPPKWLLLQVRALGLIDPDFVLGDAPLSEVVVVHRDQQPRSSADIERWRKVVGNHGEVAIVWPRQGQQGVIWHYRMLVSNDENEGQSADESEC